jgi:hypothetical protein
MPNTLQAKTTLPAGYVPARPSPIVSVPTMPTPPGYAYMPNPFLRSPMPGILTDPDQQRQVYGRGLPIRRFWPLQT